MFITDGKLPDHYSQLPTFWPEVVDAACQTNVGQGNMDGAGQKTDEGTNVDPAAAIAAAPAEEKAGARRLLRSA